MHTLPPLRSRRWHAVIARSCERPALLLALLTIAMLAPLLFDWQRTQPLPPVEAKVTRLSSKSVTQARGAVQSSTNSATSVGARPLFRLPAARSAARGRARHETLYSPALGRAMDYWLYVPPNYSGDTRRYPVLYVLHGRGGSSSEWKDLGLFDQADVLIRQQRIAPLIIVAPEGDLGYWMNHVDGGPRWGDYITQDLIPHIDGSYRTLAERRHRAIGGISMGGHGAIQLALHHPELFGAVGGHSAVFRSEAEAFPFFGTGADYQQRDPVSLVRDLNVPVGFALWLDIGGSDQWLPRTLAFHELLTERGVAHSWQLNPGGHEAGYWKRHLRAYLAWYDKALR
jgi:enterochelin esterase-like enzyme